MTHTKTRSTRNKVIKKFKALLVFITILNLHLDERAFFIQLPDQPVGAKHQDKTN
jgi:hypothetical protein